MRSYNGLCEAGKIKEDDNQVAILQNFQNLGEKIISTHSEWENCISNMRDPYSFKKNEKPAAITQSEDKGYSVFGSFFSKQDVPKDYSKKKPAIKKEKTIQVDSNAFESLDEIQGMYLFGGPGSGKTFLMDLFMTNMGLKQKRRIHYAEFM